LSKVGGLGSSETFNVITVGVLAYQLPYKPAVASSSQAVAQRFALRRAEMNQPPGMES
jgi:hypothetical protein